MKHRTFSLLFALFSIFTVFSQTTIQQIFPQGINYQAVARDTNGEILANQNITLNIHLGESNVGDYAFSENHTITTNDFGLFSLYIGKGTLSGGNFYDVPWSSGNVWIDIEIQNNEGVFETISSSKFWAVPYALHALSASEISSIPGEVAANWSTTGNTDTNSNTHFIGTKDDQALILSTNDEERLRIKSNGEAKFSGQVTVASNNLEGAQDNPDAYPLRVKGSNQGIAIIVNNENPGIGSNFVTFFDANNEALGRIEGGTGLIKEIVVDIVKAIFNGEPGININDGINGDGYYDFHDSYSLGQLRNTYFKNEFARGFLERYLDLLRSEMNFLINTIPGLLTLCVEDCDDIVSGLIDVVVNIRKLKAYVAQFVFDGITSGGVSYESGGADYAEWLLKADPNETMSVGDVVGVKGGKISKTFTNANQFMAITSNPIIVGAMPNKGEENRYEKVGMMGQVQILVSGIVKQGDYILPSPNGDGTAIALNPANLRASEYSKIIGVAWSNSDAKNTINYINTAVGFNTNQMGMMLNAMQNVINNMQDEMVKLNPDYQPVYFETDENINRNPNLAFGINSENFFGFVKDFINQNPGPNNNVISINGIATGNIVNKIIKRYVNEDMVIGDVEAGNIINKIIKQYLNEWGTPDAILDDNLIRQIIERTKEIDGEEMNLVVELMKTYLDEKAKPKINEIIDTVFINIDLTVLDDYPDMKNILEAIKDGGIFANPLPEVLQTDFLKNKLDKIIESKDVLVQLLEQ